VTSDAASLMRELSAALNAGDQDRQYRLLDPEVVQYGTRGGIDQGRVLRGRAAVLGYWQEVAEQWESQTFEPERVIDAGDVVVVLWRETARGRQSDIELESTTASVVKVRDGKILELRGYMDPDEALRDAGVEE